VIRILLPMIVPKKIKAFSLLEMAISLGIIGVILSAVIPIWKGAKHHVAIQTTQAHQAQLLKALGAYLSLYQRLPCPSSCEKGSIGVAQSKCSSSFVGIIPYRTVGIPEKMAKDGNGHWITYIVDPNLTQPHKALWDPDHLFSEQSVFCTRSVPSPFQVYDQDGRLESAQNPKDPIALILISHQKDGFFYSTPKGVAQFKGVSSLGVQLNTVLSTGTINRLGDSSGDSLLWISRNNLLALYGPGPCR